MQLIDLEKQFQKIGQKIEARIQNVFSHGQYIMGPEVTEFEKKLGEFLNVRHVISCANGTDALQLALSIFDLNPSNAVFCPTFTFFATAEVIARAGAVPVFVDSDPDTFNICPHDLKLKIKQVESEGRLQPKAVIAVDLFGLPANYPEIEKICRAKGLQLIEDSAQGLGGTLLNKRAGTFGDLGTTSFFPAKPLGCYGDGGAVFTNCDRQAELLRSYRVHGKGKDKYDNVRIGFNSRLDTIQAAILLEKLSIFQEELDARNMVAEYYTRFLHEKVKVPQVPEQYKSSWAQYTIKVSDRDGLANSLAAQNIPTAIYYATCMHNQTAFGYLGYKEGSFPSAEKMSSTVLSLPMHPYLSQIDQDFIIDSINNFYNNPS